MKLRQLKVEGCKRLLFIASILMLYLVNHSFNLSILAKEVEADIKIASDKDKELRYPSIPLEVNHLTTPSQFISASKQKVLNSIVIKTNSFSISDPQYDNSKLYEQTIAHHDAEGMDLSYQASYQQQNVKRDIVSSLETAALASSPSGNRHNDSTWETNGDSMHAPTELPADLKLPLYLRISATIACALILAIGVAGNALVPIVVIRTKYMRNSTNLFLINLSVSDLCVLLVCMPTMLIELHSRPETWLLGESMCK